MKPHSNDIHLDSANTQLPEWETPRGEKERYQQQQIGSGSSLQERISILKARTLGKITWNTSKEINKSGSQPRKSLVKIGVLVILLVVIAIALGVGLGLGLRYGDPSETSYFYI